MTDVLTLEDVTVGYGDSVVLEGISLGLQEGESLAALGRNGVGKTTLLRTLVGLTTLHGGSIRWRGKDIRDPANPPTGGCRDRLGAPGARHFSLSHGGRAPDGGGAPPGPWNAERVFRLFPLLDKRRQHLGNRLSGGEQQLLAIGRALMLNPSLLLLDEPLEGLAPIIAQDLKRVIGDLVSQSGMTVILVEQHARIALSITRSAIVLERGRIVHRSESAQLSKNPELLHRLLAVA